MIFSLLNSAVTPTSVAMEVALATIVTMLPPQKSDAFSRTRSAFTTWPATSLKSCWLVFIHRVPII